MEGVKTAIVGFILVCLILPNIIKNRHQYYMALAVFLLGLFLLVLAEAFGTPLGGFWRFCHVMSSLFDILAVLMLVLAAGGLSPRELAGNFARAYEVMRRGETEKEVIIPIPGGGPAAYDRDDEDRPKRYVIDDPSAAPPPVQEKPAEAPPAPESPDAPKPQKPSDDSIPLA